MADASSASVRQAAGRLNPQRLRTARSARAAAGPTFYQFKILDCLITNFHLPESTLVMLVSALAGREHVLTAYEEAIRQRYRFFSFGDAMFIQ